MVRAFFIAAFTGTALLMPAGNATAQFNYAGGGGLGTSPVSGAIFSGGYSAGRANSYDFGMPYYLHGYSVGPYSYSFNTTPSYTYSAPLMIPGYHQQIGNFITEPMHAATGSAPSIAYLKIDVPKANAEVWLENAPTKSQGLERRYESPPLEVGRAYSYTVKAKWLSDDGKTVVVTREVNVRPGQESTVNFRETPSEKIPITASK